MSGLILRLLVPLALASALAGQAQPPAPQLPRGPGAISWFRAAHGRFFRDAASNPLITLTTNWFPQAGIPDETGTFDSIGVQFDAFVPLPVSRNGFAIFGAEAGVRRYEFDNDSTIQDKVVHKYGPRLGYGHFLRDDLLILGYWQPSIFSDLEGGLEPDDLRLWYSTALMTWKTSEDVFLKVGFRLNDAVDTSIIPIAGVMWNFAERWKLDIVLPRQADLRWRVSDTVELSLGSRLFAEEYHIRGPAALGGIQQDVNAQELTAYMGVLQQWNDHFSTTTRAGMVVGGNYEWGFGGGLPAFDGWLEESLFVQVELGFRF